MLCAVLTAVVEIKVF